jgi:hypothetical protein
MILKYNGWSATGVYTSLMADKSNNSKRNTSTITIGSPYGIIPFPSNYQIIGFYSKVDDESFRLSVHV